MQKLHHGGVGQQLDKRLPVLDRQRIDKGELFTVVKLDQAQLRIVGTRSDKLGVQRNLGMLSRLLADLLQSGIGSDQLIIQNIILL
ncbi:cell division cycle protein 123 [Lasius niger]|uniref:Cell division cycle protein 123 n=1 Tax=Lasius niger TaxID=67767 RepID=A0A0J7JVN7_LASNI|nr:cell division cycle protein 123 [Lasius niger]